MNPNREKVRALGLCSGGLDSTLAGLVLREQGIEVEWITFETPFFTAAKARKASKKTGIPLTVKPIYPIYINMLKNPPAGYGKQMNPCMDCHALMFKLAGEMMKEKKFDFLFSGEVLGQRPMSQQRNTLRLTEKETGLEGRLLRPLSAKLLDPTDVEKEGLIDREKLYDFHGRNRKPQLELAKKLGIDDYMVMHPSGQIEQFRRLPNIALADGSLLNPLTRTPIGVCEDCRHPRFGWLRRERPSHGIVALARARLCTDCGRLCCPRHRSLSGRRWQCLGCARRSRVWRFLLGIFFTQGSS